MTRAAARRAFLACLTSAMACRSGPAPSPDPIPQPVVTLLEPRPPVSRWPAVLAEALRVAELGRYAEADRILQAHGLEHAGDPEGLESDFWRALLRTDPASGDSASQHALALIDGYLAAGPAAPRSAEAAILRRLVVAADSARGAVSTLRSATESRERARDEDIRRLTEELEKTVAELERIKRRLVPEKKPPLTP
jgi:hypothetical protein